MNSKFQNLISKNSDVKLVVAVIHKGVGRGVSQTFLPAEYVGLTCNRTRICLLLCKP